MTCSHQTAPGVASRNPVALAFAAPQLLPRRRPPYSARPAATSPRSCAPQPSGSTPVPSLLVAEWLVDATRTPAASGPPPPPPREAPEEGPAGATGWFGARSGDIGRAAMAIMAFLGAAEGALDANGAVETLS
eukprot:CAMPEP_0198311992 /NCGR_PEP_ID=MMETSP1450-20131203/3547_1 /TAXON_ID=753684 ORGANISM="Madagascaria erythrocladiodes, Strain CCMP3234" /NCGR_SAMPLE_ID=MMETSP1450 /ASSEMBLY_ACC=CAM_ASM_001115 /LENGTH=132 /DNA_ID=CAMNT_0044014915 /DNA_START=209 /DNA_END=607 /DNA_ORIENTATION=-